MNGENLSKEEVILLKILISEFFWNFFRFFKEFLGVFSLFRNFRKGVYSRAAHAELTCRGVGHVTEPCVPTRTPAWC